MRFDERRASVKVSLPENRCEQVSDAIEVLSVMESVYNQLYLATHGVNALEAVPDDDRLCLAQIETDAPAFIEIVGATPIIRILYAYLARRSGLRESMDDAVANSNFSEGQIRDAVLTRVRASLTRLERFPGIVLYEENDFTECQSVSFAAPEGSSPGADGRPGVKDAPVPRLSRPASPSEEQQTPKLRRWG